jgi:hypothetical protein
VHILAIAHLQKSIILLNGKMAHIAFISEGIVAIGTALAVPKILFVLLLDLDLLGQLFERQLLKLRVLLSKLFLLGQKCLRLLNLLYLFLSLFLSFLLF